MPPKKGFKSKNSNEKEKRQLPADVTHDRLATLADVLTYGTSTPNPNAKTSSSASSTTHAGEAPFDGWDPYANITVKSCQQQVYFENKMGAYMRIRPQILDHRKEEHKVKSAHLKIQKQEIFEDIDRMAKLKEMVETEKLGKPLQSQKMRKERLFRLQRHNPFVTAAKTAVLFGSMRRSSNYMSRFMTPVKGPEQFEAIRPSILDEEEEEGCSSSSSCDEDRIPDKPVAEEFDKHTRKIAYYDAMKSASDLTLNYLEEKSPRRVISNTRPHTSAGTALDRSIREYTKSCTDTNFECGLISASRSRAFLLRGDYDPFGRGSEPDVRIRKEFLQSEKKKENVPSTLPSLSTRLSADSPPNTRERHDSIGSQSKLSPASRSVNSKLSSLSAVAASKNAPNNSNKNSDLKSKDEAHAEEKIQKMIDALGKQPYKNTPFLSYMRQGKYPENATPQYVNPKGHILKVENKSFVMRNFGVGGRDLRSEFAALKHLKLIEIDICGNRLGVDQGITGIIPLLPTLMTLNLSNNLLQVADAQLLLGSLQDSHIIRTLHLEGNELHDAGATCAAEFLKKNTSLTKLNLNGNSIGPTGAMALSDGIRSNSSLQKLFIGWNCIRDRGALQLCDAVAASRTLVSFKAQWNGLMNAGAYLISNGILNSTKLRRLDLSQNRINDVGAMILGYALRRNSTLYKLRLDGNPLGLNGGPSVLRHARIPNGDIRIISVKDCNLSEAANTAKFNATRPKGIYSLGVADLHDRAVASELYELSLLQPGMKNFVGEMHDGSKITIVEDIFKPWIMPNKGVVQFEFHWRAASSLKTTNFASDTDVDQAMEEIAAVPQNSQKDFVLAYFRDRVMTVIQTIRFLQAMKESHDKVHLAAGLFFQLHDGHNARSEFAKILNEEEQMILARKLDMMYTFDPFWPNRSWKLDMSNFEENYMFQRLKTLDFSFRAARDKSSGKSEGQNQNSLYRLVPIDTSQYLDHSSIRSVKLNGMPKKSDDIDDSIQSGILTLSFAAPLRPTSDAPRPPTSREWRLVKKKLKESAVAPSAETAWSILKDCKTLYASQLVSAARIVGGLNMEMFSEIVLRCFQMLFDLDLLWDCLRTECTTKDLLVLGSKCGLLNIWNPEYSEGFYTLNLATPDERRVTEILVYLSVKEPGENWIGEALNGVSFELPVSWVQESVPTTGILTLKYACIPEYERRNARKKMKPKTLSAFSSNIVTYGFLGSRTISLLEVLASNTQKQILKFPLWCVESGWIAMQFWVDAPEGDGSNIRLQGGEEETAMMDDGIDDDLVIESVRGGDDVLKKMDAMNIQSILPLYENQATNKLNALKKASTAKGVVKIGSELIMDRGVTLGISLIAANVNPSESNVSANPFALLKLISDNIVIEKVRSPVENNTLYPKWNVNFKFPLPSGVPIANVILSIDILDDQ